MSTATLSPVLKGDEHVFTYEKKQVDEYHMKAKEGFAWARITISDSGAFTASSDFGDFSYSWRAFGDNFKEFLIGIMKNAYNDPHGYLYDKLKNPLKEEQVHVKPTINNIKSKVITARRESSSFRQVTRNEARELWDDLTTLESSLYSSLPIDKLIGELSEMDSLKDHIIQWESIIQNEDDIIVYSDDRQAYAFCKYIAPAFAEILQNELAQ